MDEIDGAVPFHRPSIGPEEEAEVLEVLRSGWLTTGPRAKEFERLFAHYRGTRYAVATNSCTAAMHVALAAWDIGEGDEVITTPITFASTANVIVHVGARPVFCDVQPDTLNMDPGSLAEKITDDTKAIIPVHFAGHPCDMDEILSVTGSRGIRILEDAAHAIEARYRDRPTGSLGDAGAFSFYATKNITTAEGGMLITDDEHTAERAQILSLHGISRDAWKRYGDEGYRHWEILEAGFKYNMSDMQAALGLAQLKRIDELWGARRALVALYEEGLRDVPGLRMLGRRDYVESSLHLLVVQVTEETPTDRDGLMEALNSRGIGVGVHFRAVHLNPFYRDSYGFARGGLPVAEEAGDRVLSLPLYPSMATEDVERVVEACREIMGG